MTNKPNYNLSPEFFARRRQILEQREKDLTENLRQVTQAIRALNDERSQLEVDEKLAAELHARYGSGEAVELPKKPRRPTPKRPVPSGRPWTPEEEATIMAADPKDDKALEEQLGRVPGSVAKRRRKIRRARSAEVGPAPVADPEPDSQKEIDKALFEPLHALDEELDRRESSSSEKPENFEPTKLATTYGDKRRAGPPTPRPDRPIADVATQEPSAARELAEFDGRLQRRPQAKPGIPVTGRLMDNGPEDQRVYDSVSYASREPR